MDFGDKVRAWFAVPLNRWLFVVLLVALGLRLYYFAMNSVVWWDEAEYLATALHWAFDVPHGLNPQRAPLFPLLLSVFLYLKSSEVVMRFFTLVLPSLGAVFVTYLLGKELYSARVGLLAGLFVGVNWLFLLNVTRFHVESMLLFFQFLALYLFWKGYVQKGDQKYLWFFGAVLGLAFLTKFTTVLLVPVFICMALLLDRFGFLKNKHLSYAVAIFVLLLIHYLVRMQGTFGDPLALTKASHVLDDPSRIAERGLGWSVLGTFGSIALISLLVCGALGLFASHGTFLRLDHLLKRKTKDGLADVYLLLYFVFVLAYFIFLQRGAEDRWILPLVLPLCLFAAKGVWYVADYVKQYHKHLVLVVVAVAVCLVCFHHVALADSAIMEKKDSFGPVKEASYWLLDNNPGDVVFTKSGPQMTYYTGLQTVNPGEWETFLERYDTYKPRYLVVSAFEQHEEWMYTFPPQYPDLFIPVQAYMSGGQPVLVIYELQPNGHLA